MSPVRLLRRPRRRVAGPRYPSWRLDVPSPGVQRFQGNVPCNLLTPKLERAVFYCSANLGLEERRIGRKVGLQFRLGGVPC